MDFQGRNADAVRALALQIGGEARIPDLDRHSPMVGLVAYTDRHDVERQMDVLPSPHGLSDSGKVLRAALPLPLHPDAAVLVMHPVDALRSRVANSTLPDKQTARGRRQLDAAVLIVPAYGRLTLDQADRAQDTQTRAHAARVVMSMNEAVFKLAMGRVARRLLVERQVDIAAAILRDPRLPAKHLNVRLAQIDVILATRPSPGR